MLKKRKKKNKKKNEELCNFASDLPNHQSTFVKKNKKQKKKPLTFDHVKFCYDSVWTETIIVAQGSDGQSTMGFWSVAFFAWFCNAAMHVGMADLSVFRFVKKASYGWATSAGMYVGHYMAWIAAALMLAAQIKLTQDTNPVPDPWRITWSGWPESSV